MVVDLCAYLRKYAQTVDVSCLQNKRIAINARVWLSEIIRSSSGQTMTALKEPLLSLFYNRCRALIEKGIDPIVVFDGIDSWDQTSPPKKEKRQRSFLAHSDLKFDFFSRLSEIKILLDAMGVRWMASEQEAEAQCAQLEKRGLVHGCIARDVNYILFGGSHLYQVQFNADGRGICNEVFLLSMDYISEKLFISRSCLVAMAILMGCDYYQKGVAGVGAVTALEIISEFYIMKHDHPQTILDRFWSFCTRELVCRESDSVLKLKLRKSCEKAVIDVRQFNPNSDAVSEAINFYVNPTVFDYSRSQLPKKSPFDLEKTRETLIRVCEWDPENSLNRCLKSFRQPMKSLGITRIQSSSGTDSKGSGIICSRREWAAIERLKNTASLYQYNPVIEVISVPSTSDEVTGASHNDSPQKNEKPTLKRQNPARDIDQSSPKRARKPVSGESESMQPTDNNSPTAVCSRKVIMDETPSSDVLGNVLAIEEDLPAANTLRVIQSTA
ncbi:hypothetical protein AB6A40_001743 [Gnathostoma spinigerum]|uniref:Uncharacterized protein n=1 Tax=Gnathostoma spinigerum TaxID=75299 RepID=A0ABD6ECH1_9BILA